MKYLALLLLSLAGQAFAQPADPAFPVMPAQIGGAGSPYKVGIHDGVVWVAWTHTRGTRFATNCAGLDYVIQHPETAHLTTPISVARAYWQANVFTDCSTDPAFRPAYRAARAAFNLP